MPVPKKRTTKSTKGQRRSHDALKVNQLIIEKESGRKLPRRLHRAARLGIARIKEV
ncbi:MAG: 50S ribosomal protein L32 [bacterium]|nr:50S ribosomal protein L32 [bacterium]